MRGEGSPGWAAPGGGSGRCPPPHRWLHFRCRLASSGRGPSRRGVAASWRCRPLWRRGRSSRGGEHPSQESRRGRWLRNRAVRSPCGWGRYSRAQQGTASIVRTVSIVSIVSIVSTVVRTVSIVSIVSIVSTVVRTVSIVSTVVRTVSIVSTVVRTASIVSTVVRTVSIVQ